MSLSPRQIARRDALIDAAQRVFTREGLRGASMERIAEEAKMAKATAYAYFANKDEAFTAVADRVAHQFEVVVAEALNRPGDPIAVVTRALQAKEVIAYRLAHASPHARDILGAKDQLAGSAFAQADTRILSNLAATIGRLNIPAPEDVSRILVSACAGLASAAMSPEGLELDIARLVGAVLSSLRR